LSLSSSSPLASGQSCSPLMNSGRRKKHCRHAGDRRHIRYPSLSGISSSDHREKYRRHNRDQIRLHRGPVAKTSPNPPGQNDQMLECRSATCNPNFFRCRAKRTRPQDLRNNIDINQSIICDLNPRRNTRRGKRTVKNTQKCYGTRRVAYMWKRTHNGTRSVTTLE
jgi:hypothetical protein